MYYSIAVAIKIEKIIKKYNKDSGFISMSCTVLITKRNARGGSGVWPRPDRIFLAEPVVIIFYRSYWNIMFLLRVLIVHFYK